MDDKPKLKWYFRSATLFIIFLSVGPLVLPLIWLNPLYSRNKKIIYTVIIVVISYIFGAILVKSIKQIMDYYNVVFQGAPLPQ